MKVLILAGGKGTRLSEETGVRPKPMVEIGGRPILWHIMKIYSTFGYNDFVILLGYMGYVIKEYFANYCLHQSNVTFDLARNAMSIHDNASEPWRVTLLDTGEETLTGARIKRAQPFVGNERFMLTYGDGVSDVNLHTLSEQHRRHGKAMTLTAVQRDGRFGTFAADANGRVTRFIEKPRGDGSWISGGFFLCEPTVFDFIPPGDDVALENEPLDNLARAGELWSYYHKGFWKCMDTLGDKNDLNRLWDEGRATWKCW
jgi:glucose-1-phosphate cytidylyltransferase